MWKYDPQISKTEKVVLSVFFLTYSLILLSDRFLSSVHWDLIAKSNIILSKRSFDNHVLIAILSRLPQIITNYRNQSTGQLSALSYFLSFLGYASRFVTIMIESNDLMYKAQ